MRRLPWICLHTEARNDEKLRALTDRQHRIWFRLLLYSAEREPRGVFTVDSVLAIEVAKGNQKALDDALEAMQRFALVRIEDGFGHFPAFEDRQITTHAKLSDVPERVAERQRKSRRSQA